MILNFGFTSHSCMDWPLDWISIMHFGRESCSEMEGILVYQHSGGVFWQDCKLVQTLLFGYTIMSRMGMCSERIFAKFS